MKNQHITSDLDLASKELQLRDREARCLNCGLEETASWKDEGPTAPPVSEALLGRVRRRQRREWLGYAYKIAAGFVVLVLFFQLGNNQNASATDEPREAAHFLVDSARNDTAFLLKDDLTEDTVKAVSIRVEEEEEEKTRGSDLVMVVFLECGIREKAFSLNPAISYRDGEKMVGSILTKNSPSEHFYSKKSGQETQCGIDLNLTGNLSHSHRQDVFKMRLDVLFFLFDIIRN